MCHQVVNLTPIMDDLAVTLVVERGRLLALVVATQRCSGQDLSRQTHLPRRLAHTSSRLLSALHKS